MPAATAPELEPMSESLDTRAVLDDVGEAVRRRRLELGAFLKQRRGKLTPAEVGLSGGGRRHVRGLRRDEVAEAAAIGVSWYAMLEQGRAEKVTPETLDGIAGALHLTPAERQYLRHLAEAAFDEAHPDPRTPTERLLQFVRSFRRGGAFIHSSACEVVAWNSFADELFHFSAHGPKPNLLRVMLDEPSLRERLVSPTWDEIYDRMIGNFRRMRGQFGDASHEGLIDELLLRPEFARRWQRHPVVPPPAEIGLIEHPSHGLIQTSVIAFYNPSCPTYQIILTLPRPRHATYADGDAQFRIYTASLGTETIRLRREELGGFLRNRRERLMPADVGLTTNSRRHVKGLRREEVALAAGIGTSWYALLEQGRAETISSRTLLALADALRLSARERLYVRSLAARSFSELFDLHAPPMPELLEFIRTFPDGHVHFHNGRFEMFAWNDAADDLYGFSRAPSNNLLKIMALASPRLRAAFVEPDWLTTFAHMIAHFRFTSSRFGDASYATLLDDLLATSPEFATIWKESAVVEPGPMNATFEYGNGDVRDLNFFALVPHASPEFTLIFKLPNELLAEGAHDAPSAASAGTAEVFGATTSASAATSAIGTAENHSVA